MTGEKKYFMSDMCDDCRNRFMQGIQCEIHKWWEDFDISRRRIIYTCIHINPWTPKKQP